MFSFKNLEVRVRFELTVFRICNPMQWAALPPHYKLIALHPSAVIIVASWMNPYIVLPSTRFPTGTVLALLAHFRFEVYHPYMSLYFSSSGSEYLVTLERSGVECGI